MMRLFDAKSSRWAVRHIYVFFALAGVTICASSYLVAYYSNEDVDLVMFFVFGVGSVLILLSPILAVGYILIRRRVKFELFKLKGSNVE